MTVTLQLPPTHTDLFQITAELLSEGGTVLARATRTHLPRPVPPLLRLFRQALMGPAYLLGYAADTQTVALCVIER